MADASGSIRVVKTIPFKGGTQEWSNRYFFDGVLPPDASTWETFANLLVADEAPIFPSYCSIVGVVGYGPGSDVPVYSKTYATACTYAPSGEDVQAAEVVSLAKWQTAKRSKKNHPVYLFNYFHGAVCHSATALDWLINSQKSAQLSYCQGWISGYSDGSHTHHRCGPDGTLATSVSIESYVSHRDFPS